MRIDNIFGVNAEELNLAKTLKTSPCLSEPILSYICHLLIGNIQASVACLLHIDLGMRPQGGPVCQLSGLLLDLSSIRHYN